MKSAEECIKEAEEALERGKTMGGEWGLAHSMNAIGWLMLAQQKPQRPVPTGAK